MLAAAFAVYVAVRLIEAVAVALLVIVGVAGLIAGAVMVLRARRGGW